MEAILMLAGLIMAVGLLLSVDRLASRLDEEESDEIL